MDSHSLAAFALVPPACLGFNLQQCLLFLPRWSTLRGRGEWKGVCFGSFEDMRMQHQGSMRVDTPPSVYAYFKGNLDDPVAYLV